MSKFSFLEERKKIIFPVSENRNTRVLGISTEETITVPAEHGVVQFSASAEFWVNYDAAATVPSSDIVDGTSSERSPDVRLVAAGTVIHVISATAQNIQINFYE